jgi:signal transduction histidine kinase
MCAAARCAGRMQQRLEFVLRQAQTAARRVDGVNQTLSPHSDQPHEIYLADVIGRAAESLKAAMESHDVALELSGLDQLPTVAGHALPLEVVFSNLIKNALEAIVDSGAASRRIRVSGLNQGQQAQIVIEDSGPGISEKLNRRIFDIGFTAKAGEHIGLGLHLCRKIVEQHHGSITVGQSPLGGALFKINLPSFKTNP